MDSEKKTVRALKPRSSLTAEETSLVEEYYQKHEIILEYGSGASTVLATTFGRKTIYSVESDADWAENMELWFQQNATASRVHMHYVDIGSTKEWGHPINRDKSADWYKYPLSVWERPDFIQPGVVLIDGRFRPACFLTTLLMTDGDVDVLLDDYKPRPEYRVVEEFAALQEMRGRMARFRLKKTPPNRALVRSLMSLVANSG